MGIFKNTILSSLKTAFTKTRDNLSNSIKSIIGKEQIGEEQIEDIEALLLQSDFGYEFTSQLVSELKRKIKNKVELTGDSLKLLIKELFVNSYKRIGAPIKIETGNKILLLFGINGAGKTTTLAKLANLYSHNNQVIIGSCDTFRAAANEQLAIWAKKVDLKIVEDFSKDPSAVAFETLKIAKESGYNVVLIDTAGRLHTNKNLLDELTKLISTLEKNKEDYEIEAFLVVDGNSGQNANTQLKEFSKYIRIDGLVVTKLDGTAKGGSIINMAITNNIPIKYIGIGEGIDDLKEFDPNAFIESITE